MNRVNKRGNTSLKLKCIIAIPPVVQQQSSRIWCNVKLFGDQQIGIIRIASDRVRLS